jgi:Protein of unknown function (DUF2971)
LKAILDSQQLWFTDYRHLNDPKELRHGIEQAHEALRLAQVNADGRVGLFLRFTADLLSLENLDTLAFFVGSFTRARDDLGQWRAYADDSRGVAIGFAPAMFAVGAAVSPEANENAFAGSVLYDTSAVLARHRAAIDAAAAIFQETADANIEVLRDKAVGIPFMRQLSLRLIASALIWNALTSKHRGYAGEQEVRLVTMGTADALANVTQTRVRGREIVPYTQHPWPTKGAGQIVEIVVGPSAPLDTERGIKTMLEGSGSPTAS